MDRSITYFTILIAFLVGCNKVKIEEIPCPAKPHEFCGEQQKRLINQEWKLDGWTINKSGSEGEKYSVYRAGKLIYSEGQPSHAKWFTLIKTNKFEPFYTEDEKLLFERRLGMKVGDDNPEFMESLLGMYANPVVNKLKYENVV